MLSWAIACLVIALVAALFGFSGIAGTAVNIVWIVAVLASSVRRSSGARAPAAVALSEALGRASAEPWL